MDSKVEKSEKSEKIECGDLVEIVDTDGIQRIVVLEDERYTYVGAESIDAAVAPESFNSVEELVQKTSATLFHGKIILSQ